MSTIAEVAERFAKLDLMRVCMGIIQDTQKEIIAEQQNQLQHGKQADGSDTPPYQWPEYAAAKSNPFQKTNWDLKDTGALYKAMWVDVGGDEFTTGSDDEKTPALVARASQLFGLSKEIGIPNYIEKTFAPLLNERIAKITGLELT